MMKNGRAYSRASLFPHFMRLRKANNNRPALSPLGTARGTQIQVTGTLKMPVTSLQNV